jgi:hypothetical protein
MPIDAELLGEHRFRWHHARFIIGTAGDCLADPIRYLTP